MFRWCFPLVAFLYLFILWHVFFFHVFFCSRFVLNMFWFGTFAKKFFSGALVGSCDALNVCHWLWNIAADESKNKGNIFFFEIYCLNFCSSFHCMFARCACAWFCINAGLMLESVSANARAILVHTNMHIFISNWRRGKCIEKWTDHSTYTADFLFFMPKVVVICLMTQWLNYKLT